MSTKYVDLISNASMNVFKSNTLSSFTNILPEQIDLEGTWEVALTEISYPTMYLNVTDGRFRYKSGASDVNFEQVLEIPTGFYASTEQVLHRMRDQIKLHHSDDELYWTIDELTSKLEVKLPEARSALNIMSGDISHILGFPMSVLLIGEGPHYSNFPVDILRIHSVQVYTDIIEYSIIGDTMAPVLRCFPFVTKMKRNEISMPYLMNHHSFAIPQFKRLMKRSFNQISVQLRDKTGSLLPFVGVGDSRLTLQFRKVE